MPKKTLSTTVLLAGLTLLLLASLFLGLGFGSVDLNFSEVLQGLLHPHADTVESRILWVVRLPHVAGCLLAGVGLSVSGALLQNATNNPLAGPNIIGVNAGAGFAMVLVLCLAPDAFMLAPLAAFAGAFLCTMLIIWVADRAGGSRVTVVLSGVAITTLLSAGISLIKLIDPELTIGYNAFSVGGVSNVSFAELLLPALLIGGVFLTALLLGSRLDLLCLGDPLANSLGLRARVYRTVALLLASCSAAAAVSFAGLLGFVGLMVPHIGRKLLGRSSMRLLLPVSALLGASLVILADLLGRVLFAPSQIPAGIVTAFIGAPFFFMVLLGRRNRL